MDNELGSKIVLRINKYAIITLSVIVVIMMISAALRIGFNLIIIIPEIFNEALTNQELTRDFFSNLILAEIILMGYYFFKENFHIPIRYMFYIGITTMIKDFFVYPENVVMYASVVTLMMFSLVLYSFYRFLRAKTLALELKNKINEDKF